MNGVTILEVGGCCGSVILESCTNYGRQNRKIDKDLNASGTSITCVNCNLALVTDPDNDLEVIRNGVDCINSDVLVDVDIYKIVGNTIVFPFPLENEKVIIRQW